MTDEIIPTCPPKLQGQHRSRSVLSAASVLALAASMASAVCSTQAAASVLTEAEATALVTPVYRGLTASSPTEIEPDLMQATVSDWQNCTGENACQDRAATIKRWTGRITLIPDYHLERKEVLVSGDRIVVRGEATGTPAAVFLGVQPTGKSFRIMTVDIHDVKDGKIVRTFHVEDWATAIRQLTAP